MGDAAPASADGGAWRRGAAWPEAERAGSGPGRVCFAGHGRGFGDGVKMACVQRGCGWGMQQRRRLLEGGGEWRRDAAWPEVRPARGGGG
jgi:hypothetical protein